MRVDVLAILAAALYLAVGCGNPNPAKTGSIDRKNPAPETEATLEGDPPPFSVPIVVMDKAGQDVGLGSAALVDRESGLFATNAHVIDAGQKYEVRVGGLWYPVNSPEHLVNWNADLALVRIADAKPIFLPKAAPLSENSPEIGQVVYTKGYVADRKKADQGRNKYIVYRAIEGRVEKLMATRQESIASMIDYIEFVSNFAISGKLKGQTCMNKIDKIWKNQELNKIDLTRLVLEFCPKEILIKKTAKKDRSLFYDKFILVHRVWEQKHLFESGLSGSPVLNDSGYLMGLHSHANSGLSINVPLEEIKALLEKANNEVKKRLNAASLFFIYSWGEF